jgi:exodeoxyribonuclease-3
MSIVIATWNVNSIRARMAHALAFLEARRPDVLLLQELKGLEFPALEFEALGYHSVAIGQKSYNGVAILSKLPIEIVTNKLAGSDEDTHARYLETIIDTPAKLRVVCIYLPNGNPVGTDKFLYKLQWMERLIVQMAAWKNDPIPTIIGGDFNVIPEDIDCDKPANWVRDALFQPETRDRYRAMLAMGWTDAFRALYPDTRDAFTFWDYFRQAFERNRGIRIDHFLLSPALAPRLQACEIDKTPRAQEKPSDHTPVLVTLN